MIFKEQKQESVTLFEGNVIKLQYDTVSLPNGKTAAREVVHHPGGVGIVAVDEKKRVACVRQYRYAVSETLLEIPAGKLDSAENVLHAAKRELKEETGIVAQEFIPIGTFYASPGFCDEKIHLFLARNLSFDTPNPDPDEFLEVEWYSLSALKQMILQGEMKDAKTIVGILHASEIIGKDE